MQAHRDKPLTHMVDLIGDSESDELLASACGVPFLRVAEGHIA